MTNDDHDEAARGEHAPGDEGATAIVDEHREHAALEPPEVDDGAHLRDMAEDARGEHAFGDGGTTATIDEHREQAALEPPVADNGAHLRDLPEADHKGEAGTSADDALTPQQKRDRLIGLLREARNIADTAKRTQMLDHVAHAVVVLADTLLESLR